MCKFIRFFEVGRAWVGRGVKMVEGWRGGGLGAGAEEGSRGGRAREEGGRGRRGKVSCHRVRKVVRPFPFLDVNRSG